jgi:flagellar motility protein MotE (MotC chaperone)
MIRLPRFNVARRAGRGSVVLIAGLLLSSAVLRLVSGVALAEDADPGALPEPEQVATHDAEMQSSVVPKDRAEMGSLLEALQAREARIAKQERQIELRAKALRVADDEITKRLNSLKTAEEALRDTLALADGAAEDDLTRLTAVYESMKPKDSAALFETMEPGFAAGFLGRMRPDIAANVMAGLSPEVAYSISVILAGRNAKAPKS